MRRPSIPLSELEGAGAIIFVPACSKRGAVNPGADARPDDAQEGCQSTSPSTSSA